ncbi:MAG: RNA polymerase sigma-54 factor [Cryomorphaceae bacterium]|jgi:RNA polymerase sigma-54 factor
MSDIGLQQNLSQQQTLSPKMRQSLEILQANSLELSQLLQQAILTNPALEITTTEEALPEETPADAEHDTETISDLDDHARDDYITTKSSTPGPSQETIDYLYDSIVAPLSLQQHLTEQINNEEISNDLRTACHEIIANINDRGFLDQPLTDIMVTSIHSLEILEKGLVKIQHLDPAGVGAHDLIESLLIQLQKRNQLGSLAYQIVADHLPDLAQKKLPYIAKQLKTSVEKIVQAAETITTLTPDPGAEYDPTSNPYIVPDIRFTQDTEGEWKATLTNEHIPEVTISHVYKDLLASSADSKTRTYLKDQIKDGKQIITAISQRQHTLLRISEELIKRQQDFLVSGTSALKPLTMNELAEVIKVHPATISRAVAGKYALTPHGVIELRTFFTSGYQSKDGAQVSNTSIKDTIQNIIQDEPSSKPLSDTAIEKILAAKGLKVARRTIAKYRDQLGILPSHLRKKF